MGTLNILVFNWRCWLNPTIGEAEVFTHEVIKRWVEAGHNVSLFASEFPNCRRGEVVDGIRIARAGGRIRFIGKLKKYYGKYFSKESNLSQISRRCC